MQKFFEASGKAFATRCNGEEMVAEVESVWVCEIFRSYKKFPNAY